MSRARALLNDVFAGDDSADNSYGSLTSSDSRAQPVDVRRRRALGLAALDLFAVLLLHGSHDCDALAFGIKAHHGCGLFLLLSHRFDFFFFRCPIAWY